MMPSQSTESLMLLLLEERKQEKKAVLFAFFRSFSLFKYLLYLEIVGAALSKKSIE